MPFTLTIALPQLERKHRMAQHPTTDPDKDEYGKVETPDRPTPEEPYAPGGEDEPPPDERDD
jgi:hypothetical protein